jgi:transcriptional regulator with XRE-family HTH domain
MAHKLGISLTAYRDLEKGNTAILNGNIPKIASLLDTPTEEIVLGYFPAQTDDKDIREIREEYSGKINVLEKRIADMEKLIRIQEEHIASKNEIISMLKKRLEEGSSSQL